MTDARVVVVGAGKMGAHHARVFAAEPGARLAGVFDADRERAVLVAARHGAPVMRSLDEAIERADLVVVATPTTLHFAHASAALAAGRAVLVEKPVAASAAEARALCEAAAAHGAALLVGHSERFDPVVRALASAARDLEVTAISTRRTAATPADDLCLNLAVHDIDLVALFARAPVELVTARGSGGEAELLLRAGKTAARAEVARGVTRRVRRIRLEAAGATFVGDLVARQLARDRARVFVDDFEPLALQAAAALRAIAGQPSHVASGEAGLRAVQVAERAAARLAQSLAISAAG